MLKNAQDVDLAYQFAKNLNQEVENGKVKTRAFISMVGPYADPER